MKIPFFLSVEKSTSLLKSARELHKQNDLSENNFISTLPLYKKPFYLIWFAGKKLDRFISRSFIYLAVFIAWTLRIFLYSTCAIIAISLINFAINSSNDQNIKLEQSDLNVSISGELLQNPPIAENTGANYSSRDDFPKFNDSPTISPLITTTPSSFDSPTQYSESHLDPESHWYDDALPIAFGILQLFLKNNNSTNEAPPKPVHVDAYQRADGTPVKSYQRSLPNR